MSRKFVTGVCEPDTRRIRIRRHARGTHRRTGRRPIDDVTRWGCRSARPTAVVPARAGRAHGLDGSSGLRRVAGGGHRFVRASGRALHGPAFSARSSGDYGTVALNVEFMPADFRRFGPLLEAQRPRVMTTVAAPPDADGWCSLSLHAGGTVGELHRAGADPAAAAGRRGLPGLPADIRTRRAPSLPCISTRSTSSSTRLMRRWRCPAAKRRRPSRQGDRAACRRLHPVGRDPADRDRLDPQPDRHGSR